jgi:hypothetical protein
VLLVQSSPPLCAHRRSKLHAPCWTLQAPTKYCCFPSHPLHHLDVPSNSSSCWRLLDFRLPFFFLLQPFCPFLPSSFFGPLFTRTAPFTSFFLLFGPLRLELPFLLVRTSSPVGTGYHELLAHRPMLLSFFLVLLDHLHASCCWRHLDVLPVSHTDDT